MRTLFSPHIWKKDLVLLLFRVLFSLQLFVVHGLKKIEESADEVPNPLELPASLNYNIALLSDTLCPLFILIGFLTRLSALPIAVITGTGYLVVHKNDALAVKDIPYMYALCSSLLLATGAGKWSVDNYLNNKLNG